MVSARNAATVYIHRYASKRLHKFMEPIFRLTRLVLPAHLPTEEQRIRSFLVLFQIALIPVLLFFGFHKMARNGVTFEVWLILSAALLSLVTIFMLRYIHDLTFFHFLGSGFVTLFILYEVAIGAGGGAAYLWSYIHPVAIFFIFGKRTGLWWVIFAWLMLAALMVLTLDTYRYDLAVGVRFLASYTLVCFVSYGLESARHRHYTALAAETQALEETFHQIQTLHRLMPICASCKKIRDDDGYWHQVDSYIGRYAEVQFSHSICPTCRERLYPAGQTGNQE